MRFKGLKKTRNEPLEKWDRKIFKQITKKREQKRVTEHVMWKKRKVKVEGLTERAEQTLRKKGIKFEKRYAQNTLSTYLNTKFGKIRISDHAKTPSHFKFNQYTGDKDFIDTSNFFDLRYKKDLPIFEKKISRKRAMERLKKIKKLTG